MKINNPVHPKYIVYNNLRKIMDKETADKWL